MQRTKLLKVGDKVRIKSKEWFESLATAQGNFKGREYKVIQSYPGAYCCFNQDMSELCGKIGIIKTVGSFDYQEGDEDIDYKYYRLDIDDNNYNWQNYMFEEHLSDNLIPVPFGDLWVVFDDKRKIIKSTEFYSTEEDAEKAIEELVN